MRRPSTVQGFFVTKTRLTSIYAKCQRETKPNLEELCKAFYSSPCTVSCLLASVSLFISIVKIMFIKLNVFQ